MIISLLPVVCFLYIRLFGRVIINGQVYLVKLCILLVFMGSHCQVHSSELNYLTFRQLDLAPYRNRLSLCPENQTSSPGSDSCVCVVGTYLSGGACVACPEGSYKDVSGNQGCTSCTNANSLPGSTEASECICLAGYHQSTPGTCELCASGSYKPFEGNMPCIACHSDTTTEGSSQPFISIEACKCKVGLTGPDGGLSDGSGCDSCSPNTYKDVIGSSTCSSCPTNSSSDTGSVIDTACQCNPGYEGPEGGPCVKCQAGKYRSSGLTECTSCPLHSTSFSASDELGDCFCVAGYDGGDPASCQVCSAGKFKSTNGYHSCENCNTNSYSTPGATQCIGCSSNSQAVGGDITCKCSPGYFSTDLTLVCQPCATGTSKSTVDNQTCTQCLEKQYSTQAAAACQACPLNSVTTTVGNIDSCLCEEGYERNSNSCDACDAGHNKSSVGNSQSCQACPANTYSGVGAAATCVDCPLHTKTYSITGNVAVSACLCVAGYEMTESGCVLCSSNFYCTGQSNKAACLNGLGLSPAGSTAESACYCPAGRFLVSATSTCEECPQNAYCPEGTVTPLQCSTATNGHSTAPAGSDHEEDCTCVPGYEPT